MLTVIASDQLKLVGVPIVGWGLTTAVAAGHHHADMGVHD